MSDTYSPAKTALDYFGLTYVNCGKDPAFERSYFTGNLVLSLASLSFVFIGKDLSNAPFNLILPGDVLMALIGSVDSFCL